MKILITGDFAPKDRVASLVEGGGQYASLSPKGIAAEIPTAVIRNTLSK